MEIPSTYSPSLVPHFLNFKFKLKSNDPFRAYHLRLESHHNAVAPLWHPAAHNILTVPTLPKRVAISNGDWNIEKQQHIMNWLLTSLCCCKFSCLRHMVGWQTTKERLIKVVCLYLKKRNFSCSILILCMTFQKMHRLKKPYQLIKGAFESEF